MTREEVKQIPMDDEFKEYMKLGKAELRGITLSETEITAEKMRSNKISVSAEDEAAGSPKLGDMVARNPANHNDQWLVAQKYFDDNFVPLEKEQ